MVDTSTNTEIVAAARVLLEDGSARASYSTLMQALYSPIDRGIGSALSHYNESQAEAVVHGFFADFLHLKLRSTSFLEGLIKADHPKRYATTVAANFARDEIRKRPLLQNSTPVETDDGAWDPAELLQEDDALSVQQAIEAAEDQDERQCWYEELPIDDQLLLGILFVELRELPMDLVELLAKRRALDVAGLRAELEARAGEQGAKRHDMQLDLDGRAARIVSLQRTMSRVQAAIRQRDGDQAAPPRELSSTQVKLLRGSQAALLDASAEERSGYMAYLEGRLTHLVTLQKESRDKLSRDFPAGPKYEEVLCILGQWPNSPAEQRKAVNAVTVRFRRIRKRLQQQVTAKEDQT